MENRRFNISIIGAGKVGVAVGNLLAGKGHRIVAATATTRASLDKAAPFLPGAHLLQDNAEAAALADVILITAKDEQIRTACDDLVAGGAIKPTHTLIHMSGAASLEVLSSAKDAGAKIASLHPIQSLASIEMAIERLPGSYFGITADGSAREVALQIAHDLDGRPIEIADENKVLYHAAACIASNYLVTLLNLAEEVYAAAGLDRGTALEAMMQLVGGTTSNIRSVGTTAALTGPIARGDAKIVKQHLEALGKMDEDVLDIYKTLGLRTIDIAVEKGALIKNDADRLTAILKDGDANDGIDTL